jgi:hypothetical protein
MSGTYALLKDSRIVRIVGERSLDSTYDVMVNPVEKLDVDAIQKISYNDVVCIDTNLNMLVHQQRRSTIFKFVETLNTSIFKNNKFHCLGVCGGLRWKTKDDRFTIKFFAGKEITYSLYFMDDEICYEDDFTSEYVLKCIINRVIRKHRNIFSNKNHELYDEFHNMMSEITSDTLTFYNLVNYLNENITMDDPLIYDMEGFCASKNNTYMLSKEDDFIEFTYNACRIYKIKSEQSLHTLAIDIRLALVEHCKNRIAHHTDMIKKYITLENKFSVKDDETQ